MVLDTDMPSMVFTLSAVDLQWPDLRKNFLDLEKAEYLRAQKIKSHALFLYRNTENEQKSLKLNRSRMKVLLILTIAMKKFEAHAALIKTAMRLKSVKSKVEKVRA